MAAFSGGSKFFLLMAFSHNCRFSFSRGIL